MKNIRGGVPYNTRKQDIRIQENKTMPQTRPGVLKHGGGYIYIYIYILDPHRSPYGDCEAVQRMAPLEIVELSNDFECFFEGDFVDFDRILEERSIGGIGDVKQEISKLTSGFEVSSPGDIDVITRAVISSIYRLRAYPVASKKGKDGSNGVFEGPTEHSFESSNLT